MQKKILKFDQVEYEPEEWAGKDESGINPIGDRVLILPDKVKSKTSGGVYITDDLTMRHNLGATTGTVIALGDDAYTWNSDRTRPWSGSKPQIGQRVYFERYAGVIYPGDDGKAYRVVDDKCIGAVRSAA